MDTLDLRLTGIQPDDVRAVLDGLEFSEGSYEIDVPRAAGGADVVELLLQLKHIDISLLDLLVGYFLGRGVRLSEIQKGTEVLIGDLKKVRALTDRLKDPKE